MVPRRNPPSHRYASRWVDTSWTSPERRQKVRTCPLKSGDIGWINEDVCVCISIYCIYIYILNHMKTWGYKEELLEIYRTNSMKIPVWETPSTFIVDQYLHSILRQSKSVETPPNNSCSSYYYDSGICPAHMYIYIYYNCIQQGSLYRLISVIIQLNRYHSIIQNYIHAHHIHAHHIHVHT